MMIGTQKIFNYNDLFLSTVRIETIYPDGSRGVGTGSILIDRRGESPYIFIVTNRHVVEGGTSGVITLQRKIGTEFDIGNPVIVEIERYESLWEYHPDDDIDVAILNLEDVYPEIKKI